MTDYVGEHMTDEELYDAQPAKDYKFQLIDTQVKLVPREVVVPNWIARDGHWGDVHSALDAAREGNMATATERITKALERAREFGYQQAQDEAENLRKRQYEGRFITPNPNLGPDGPRSYGDCDSGIMAPGRHARQQLSPEARRGELE